MLARPMPAMQAACQTSEAQAGAMIAGRISMGRASIPDICPAEKDGAIAPCARSGGAIGAGHAAVGDQHGACQLPCPTSAALPIDTTRTQPVAIPVERTALHCEGFPQGWPWAGDRSAPFQQGQSAVESDETHAQRHQSGTQRHHNGTTTRAFHRANNHNRGSIGLMKSP